MNIKLFQILLSSFSNAVMQHCLVMIRVVLAKYFVFKVHTLKPRLFNNKRYTKEINFNLNQLLLESDGSPPVYHFHDT